MRTANNQHGFAVERHDGPVVGWVAISEVMATRGQADDCLLWIKRTPGAEYRVNVALISCGDS